MKDEYLDYVEDIIKAMDDACKFVEGMSYIPLQAIQKQFMLC
ncbi:MAG TPA: hypothetical protein VK536_00515 [Candidatus Limnocylindrales bacterium]|nr:hypothetical protein [Candidatus Limnocylindrales bacterium]